jgi:hypothetical protein
VTAERTVPFELFEPFEPFERSEPFERFEPFEPPVLTRLSLFDP